MARQRDSKLVGTVGNLIFYNRLGEYCIRTKPDSVQRTPASVNSGFNFGRASKIAGQIRNRVVDINPCKSDIRVYYRLTGAINKLISWKEKKDQANISMPAQLPYIYGFQFNDQADLDSISAIKPSVNSANFDSTQINLASFVPNQSLQAPIHTDHILLKMILLGVDVKEAETGILGKAEVEIPHTGESFQPPVISIPASSKPGDLAILVMAVQYMMKRNGGIEMLTDKKKLPCGIGWVKFG